MYFIILLPLWSWFFNFVKKLWYKQKLFIRIVTLVMYIYYVLHTDLETLLHFIFVRKQTSTWFS